MPEIGLSLRKKKKGFEISGPKLVSNDGQYNGAPPVLERSEPSMASIRSRQGGQGDKTADLVKRRYSTRVHGYPVDLSNIAPPLPALPSMPDAVPRMPEQVTRGGIRVDMRALRDPTLLPEQYVASVLANADEIDIMNFQAELKKLQNRTSVDLQDNFNKNRHRFIQISKEADILKAEMKGLKGLLSELTAALDQATSALDSHDTTTKRSNRSSLANLEALWSTQLHALWKRVEGSQKYLPSIPGRHVVCESGRWVELNAATWKPRRRVHLILLNDHLLIASDKKRNDRQSVYQQTAAQSVLVAERCWPLNDVQIADISRSSPVTTTTSRDDRSTIVNAINVRAGNESWTFSNANASEAKAEKSALLTAFRKAAEDLRRTNVAEHGERDRAMDELTFLTGRERQASIALQSAGSLGANQTIDAGLLSRSAVLVEVDGRQQNLRWVESQIDALDMDVALQRFEEAVARKEKLTKIAKSMTGHDVAQKIITAKIDERAASLASNIRRRLRDQSARLTPTKENVGWLIRLGYEEMAKQDYLDSRTETMRLRTRQLPFTGSLPPHLTALTYVTFTLILHTFRVFTASFSPATGSAVVKWAKDRVDAFNTSVRRQLSSVQPGSELWDECVKTVQTRAAVLAEVGVDFTSLVAKGLESPAPTIIKDHTATAAAAAVAKETVKDAAAVVPKPKTEEGISLGSARYEGRPKLEKKKSHGGSRSREREPDKERDVSREPKREKDRDGSRERKRDKERDGSREPRREKERERSKERKRDKERDGAKEHRAKGPR